MANQRNQGETPTGRTAKHIAYSLIGVYGGALLGVGIFAAILEIRGDDNLNDGWFELLKNGFLILGGSFSTVVGYYFGSRGVQEAEATARDAESRAQEAERRLRMEREEWRRRQEEDAPTYGETVGGETGLIAPEQFEEPEQG